MVTCIHMTIYKRYKHGATLKELIKENGVKKVVNSLKHHGIKCFIDGKGNIDFANEIRKCFNKQLNGKWDWSVNVWFGTSIFANCEIKSPYGAMFNTKEDAEVNLERVLKQLKLK